MSLHAMNGQTPGIFSFGRSRFVDRYQTKASPIRKKKITGTQAAVNGEILCPFPKAMNKLLRKAIEKNKPMATAAPPTIPRRE